MVERLPAIEVLLPVHKGDAPSVTWNGELIEADEVKVEEDEKVQVVIGGVTYDEHNAAITVRHDRI
jgi:hypothetical protein